MVILFAVLLILYLINIRINLQKINEDYLSKKNTTIINGLFVIIVFFSHFIGYINADSIFETSLKIFLEKFGQLMVTPFLFYSGYGIYESIKKNQKKYIKEFPKKRFFVTFLNFNIAVLIFLIMQTILGNEYGLKTIFLSFIGWESLGNSNWYMFVVFYLYIMVIVCFKLFKKNNGVSLTLITILSIIYILVVNKFKPNFWCDTILCFSAGMYYSYYKNKIDVLLKENKNYFITSLVLIILFIVTFYFRENVFIHNIMSIIFVLLLNLFSMKISYKNKIFVFFGKNVFWIYILQRIPMILFNGKMNIYSYFIVCFIITILLTLIIKRLCTMINSIIEKYSRKCYNFLK